MTNSVFPQPPRQDSTPSDGKENVQVETGRREGDVGNKKKDPAKPTIRVKTSLRRGDSEFGAKTKRHLPTNWPRGRMITTASSISDMGAGYNSSGLKLSTVLASACRFEQECGKYPTDGSAVKAMPAERIGTYRRRLT